MHRGFGGVTPGSDSGAEARQKGAHGEAARSRAVEGVGGSRNGRPEFGQNRERENQIPENSNKFKINQIQI